MRDIVGHLAIASSIDPQIYTTTQTGAIIDLKGYDSAMISLLVGTLTDGVHTPKLQHGDDSGLSDAADVSGTDLDGAFGVTVSDTNQAVGYLGTKRYCRVVVTITGTPSTGCEFAAAVVRGKAALQN